MKNIRFYNRFGGSAAITVIVLACVVLAAGCVFSLIYSSGSKTAAAQSELFEKGYLDYLQRNYDDALDKFNKAETLYGATSLEIYRMMNKDNAVKKEDLAEIKFSLSVVAAYNDFFNLKKESKWVDVAHENLNALEKSGNSSVDEYSHIFNTLKGSAELCYMYSKEEYEEAFKKLLEVEQGALESDRDFFIFEVRFMIASAEALKEPLILEKAQELLGVMAGSVYDETGAPDARITALIRLANE